MRLAGRAVRRWRARCASASGFTAVELTVSIVILGVVITPIAFAAMQAIELVPESGQRTKAAVSRSELADAFANDLSQTSVVEFPTIANAADAYSTTTRTCTTSGSPTKLAELTHTWGATSSTVTYWLAVSGDGPTKTVSVQRQDGATTRDFLTGYCTSGTIATINYRNAVTDDNNADQSDATQHRQLLVTLRLGIDPTDTTMSPTHIGGALRITGA